MAEPLPLFVVINTRSGREAELREQTIAAALAQAGRRHELLPVKDPRQMPRTAAQAAAAARRDGGAVVAAGGDGTINAVAHAALDAGVPLGVLPQGTFNYFGRTHGIPEELGDALQALLAAEPTPVQVGRISSADAPPRLFIVNASLGLYPQLLEDREATKRELGRSRLVAAWAAVRTVFNAHRPLRLELSHAGRVQQVRTPTLFVGNNALQLEQTGIPGLAALEHGALVGLTLAPVGTLAMLGLMLRGAMGQLGRADSVFSFAFQRLAVRPAPPRGRARMKVATDGEVFHLRAPLLFEPWPAPLMLLKRPPVAPLPGLGAA
jgi:diacylglycerol kinase family enzyme